MADPREILARMDVTKPTSVQPITGGWDTSLWRVEANGSLYALRVLRPGQTRRCEREALVMRELHGHGLNVPMVHAVGDDPPALLLEWCPGKPVLSQIKESPLSIWQLGLEMGKTHARIHEVPVSQALQEALPAIHDIDTDSSRLSVLHLDFHALNVMTDGREMTGVLDWANVAVGDYRVDLARTVTLLRLAPLPPAFPSIIGSALRGVLEVAWRRGYRGRQAIDPFREMDPFYVWAGSMMERDLRPQLGKPGVWLRESDLLRIHRWTVSRRQRGLIAPDDA